MVALVYAARHPEHPAGLTLVSASLREDVEAIVAAFRRLGGDHVADVARAEAEDSTLVTQAAFGEICLPFYSRQPDVEDFLASWARRTIHTPQVELAFTRAASALDLGPYAEQVACPVLLMSGADDPIMPPALQQEVADALGDRLTRFELFDDCGHLVMRDRRDEAHALIKSFVQEFGVRQPSQTPEANADLVVPATT